MDRAEEDEDFPIEQPLSGAQDEEGIPPRPTHQTVGHDQPHIIMMSKISSSPIEPIFVHPDLHKSPVDRVFLYPDLHNSPVDRAALLNALRTRGFVLLQFGAEDESSLLAELASLHRFFQAEELDEQKFAKKNQFNFLKCGYTRRHNGEFLDLRDSPVGVRPCIVPEERSEGIGRKGVEVLRRLTTDVLWWIAEDLMAELHSREQKSGIIFSAASLRNHELHSRENSTQKQNDWRPEDCFLGLLDSYDRIATAFGRGGPPLQNSNVVRLTAVSLVCLDKQADEERASGRGTRNEDVGGPETHDTSKLRCGPDKHVMYSRVGTRNS